MQHVAEHILTMEQFVTIMYNLGYWSGFRSSDTYTINLRNEGLWNINQSSKQANMQDYSHQQGGIDRPLFLQTATAMKHIVVAGSWKGVLHSLRIAFARNMKQNWCPLFLETVPIPYQRRVADQRAWIYSCKSLAFLWSKSPIATATSRTFVGGVKSESAVFASRIGPPFSANAPTSGSSPIQSLFVGAIVSSAFVCVALEVCIFIIFIGLCVSMSLYALIICKRTK